MSFHYFGIDFPGYSGIMPFPGKEEKWSVSLRLRHGWSLLRWRGALEEAAAPVPWQQPRFSLAMCW